MSLPMTKSKTSGKMPALTKAGFDRVFVYKHNNNFKEDFVL